MSFVKRFKDWFQQKPQIEKSPKRLRFKEREVWYLHFGINVGFEMDGKGDQEFLRPCLVLKKISQDTFYALPLTSKQKEGSWYHPSSINGKEGRYIFSQMKLVDAKRLKYLAATVPEKEFSTIKKRFIEFFDS